MHWTPRRNELSRTTSCAARTPRCRRSSTARGLEFVSARDQLGQTRSEVARLQQAIGGLETKVHDLEYWKTLYARRYHTAEQGTREIRSQLHARTGSLRRCPRSRCRSQGHAKMKKFVRPEGCCIWQCGWAGTGS